MNPLRAWDGQHSTDETLLNASHETVDFVLPNQAAQQWAIVLDTANERGFVEPQAKHTASEKLPLPERSFVLLRRIS